MGKTIYIVAVVATAIMNAWGQSGTPQPDMDGVYPSWGEVKSAKLVHAVAAEVVPDVRLKGLRHICTLRVVVGPDANPKSIEVLNKTKTPFDDAAISAVRKSQFVAGNLNGAPVTTQLLVRIPFYFGTNRPALPQSGSSGNEKNWRPPIPIFAAESEFQEDERRAGFSGVVVFQVLVTEEGLPTRVQLVTPLANGLDKKAVDAVSKYRFRPATLDGIPVPSTMTIEMARRSY